MSRIVLLDRDEAFYLMCRLVADNGHDASLIQARLLDQGVQIDPQTRYQVDAALMDPRRRAGLVASVIDAMPLSHVRARALCDAVDIVWADREMEMADLDHIQDTAQALAARPILA